MFPLVSEKQSVRSGGPGPVNILTSFYSLGVRLTILSISVGSEVWFSRYRGRDRYDVLVDWCYVKLIRVSKDWPGNIVVNHQLKPLAVITLPQMDRTGWWEPRTLNSMEDERGSQSRCRFDVMGYEEVFSDYSELFLGLYTIPKI